MDNSLVFLIISPNFPKCFHKFAKALKSRGVTVLGIGDAFPNEIHGMLKDSLTEYVQCYDLKNMKQLISDVSYLQNKYGKIDWIESNNEFWLEQDGMLREWFGIRTGIFYTQMLAYKAKSEMKKYFEKANVKCAKYHLSDNLENTIKFAEEVGYPLFVKPDVGVGAANSYKINNLADLASFYQNQPKETYIFEQFVDGEIYSFDGITNSKGEIIFKDSEHFLVNTDVMKSEDTDDSYYVFKEIPKEIDVIGERIVSAFHIKNRCFHIELFKLNKDIENLGKKGEFVALEVNMRTPGGNTPDLISFASGVEFFEIYADSIVYDANKQNMNIDKSYAISVSRKDKYKYLNSYEDIIEKYKENIKEHGRYDDAIADVMGNSYYMATFDTIEAAMEFDIFVRSKKI